MLLIIWVLGACSFGSGRTGGQFLPGDGLPKGHRIDIAAVPNAVPKPEKLSETGNKPYRVFGKGYVPLRSAQGYRAEGIASWYGTKFHGRRTSSGEPYNMYAMSAAHRTLPLPSYARVTNLANGRSVIVKVNDRGPFVDPKNRIVDLSYVAAAKLGVVATGTARVRIEAVMTADQAPSSLQTASINKPAQPIKQRAKIPMAEDTTVSYLQMGAFSMRLNADQLLRRLAKAGVKAYVQQADRLFKVKSGPYADADEALKQKLRIDRMLNIEARVVFE